MTQHDLISPTIEDPDGVVADAAIDPDDAALSHPLTADADIRPESPTFAEFGVDERIVTALADPPPRVGMIDAGARGSGLVLRPGDRLGCRSQGNEVER